MVLLYYYINLRSSIMLSLSSGYIYIYIYIYIYKLGISLSCSFVATSELFCCDVLKIKSRTLLPNKSPIFSAAFSIARFEAVLSVSVADCLAWSKNFLTIFINQVFTYFFDNIFIHNFSKRQKFTSFYKFLISKLNCIGHHFLYLLLD